MMTKIVRIIDMINEKTGRVVSYAYIPLVLICVTEVVMRYVFNKPTIWAWDVASYIFCLITVMGAGFTLLHDGHVKIDIFVERLSPRKKLIVDLMTKGLFILTACVLLQQTGLMAATSISIREKAASYWSHPLYPVKIVMFIGVLLLFLQAISQLLSSLATLMGLRRNEQHDVSKGKEGEQR